MNYSALKAAINAAIKTNGNKEITGAVLNTVLNAMTTALGEGYQYAGAATPSGTPTATDGRVFYLANGAGTYTNYGGLVVNAGELALLRFDTEWHKDSVSVGSEQVQSDWTEADSTKKSYIKNKPTIPTDKVFVAAYDSEDPSACTPYADILAAYNADKMIFVNEILSGDRIFYNLQWAMEGTFVFVSVATELYGDVYILSVSSDDDWSKDVAEFALKSSIPAAQIQSDWDQNDSSKKDFIKNKPALKAVATSGSYNDLTNKPTIPADKVYIANLESTADEVGEKWAEGKMCFLEDEDDRVYSLAYCLYDEGESRYEVKFASAGHGYIGLLSYNWDDDSWDYNSYNIPTKTSDLENDEDFVSSVDLSAVATTGRYDDLLDKPSIPASQVSVFDEDSTPEDVAAAYNAGEACFFKQPSEESFYALVHCSVNGDAALFSRAYSDAEGYHIAFIEWQVDEWVIDMVSIPTISSSITASSTNSEAAGAKAVWDLGETKQPKTTSQVLTYQASQTYVLTANKIATLDASAAASGNTITINLPASPAVTDCFDLQITIGTNAPTINWPSGISWLGGSAPTINASKKYEINIMNGLAVAGEF